MKIRQRLHIDEERYYKFGRLHHQRGRDHYIYAILDEIEQLGIAQNNSKEFFDEIPESIPSDEDGRRIVRNLLLTVQREQALYARRLIEILTELINFLQINTNAYFDHYLLYKELDQYKKRKSDFETYFNIANSNTQSAIDLLKRSIGYGEVRIQLDKCWYLKRAKGASPPPNGEGELLPFQSAFNLALSLATKSERAVIGFHYGEAFRSPSHNVHLNIGGVQSSVSFSLLSARRGQIIFLALYCLLRCRRLAGMRSRTGFGPQIARVLTNTSIAKHIFNHVTRMEVSKGDFVIVFGSLCEVTNTKRSRYGYRSFRVRYLSNPPLSEREDWFPALNVTKLIDGKKLRNDVIALLRSYGAIPPNPRRIREAMRQTALDIWQQFVASQRNV